MDVTMWQIVASGGAASLIANLRAISNRDTRARLLEQAAFEGQFQVQLAGSLGFVPHRQTVQEFFRNFRNMEAAPTFAPEIPIPVVTVLEGNRLEVEAVEGCKPFLYSWDYVTFAFVGAVDPSVTLETGVYVVAHHVARTRQDGLPTAFISIQERTKKP